MCGSMQGNEQFEVVPDSSLVVARTATRANTSNYYVNDKKSNFKEVTDLLKAKGVDLNNNRFLILQARSPNCTEYTCSQCVHTNRVAAADTGI